MKIGIQTWFYGSNYGAKAQSYALQKIIESFGYDVKMIDYRTDNYEKINIQMNENYKGIIWHPIRRFYCRKRNRKLMEAISMYNLTPYVHNADDINKLGFDAIVYGSDAIFNVKHPLFNDIYMGVGVKTRKISYSPSCENLDPKYILSESECESLRHFSSVSVRDVNTQALLENNCNIKSEITLDPTLLYDFKEISTEWIYRNYLLVYSFSDWHEYANRVREFAKEKKLKILSVGSYCGWADVNIDDASFEQWILSFKYADYVFTDSFHGTIFSIKNEKEIILISRKDKQAKIQSLLNDAGVNREFYDGKTNIQVYINDYKLDYKDVRFRLDRCRKESLTFLRRALEDKNG